MALNEDTNPVEGNNTNNNSNNKIKKDRSIGINFSIPQSLLDKIDEKRGQLDRSKFVREAIYKYLESV